MSTDTNDADRPPRPDAPSVNYTEIAPALKSKHQWLCWRHEWKPDRGEWTKVPVNPTGSYRVDPTDSDNWVSFEAAREGHESPDSDTQGLAFAFSPDGTITGVDLDDCREPGSGRPEEWAKAIVETLDSFTEVSPSGEGYHVYVHGFVPDGGNRSGPVEMYDQTRFFTVTGQHVPGTPETVNQRMDKLRQVHAEHIAEDSESGDDTGSSGPRGDVDLSDKELLEKARNAENGDKFRRLWNGNTAGYPSQSEADLALCGMLAFWTQGDKQAIDRLFRESGLMREKWDETRGSDTYGERTIAEALEGRTEFYDPESGDTVAGRDTTETAEPLPDSLSGEWFDPENQLVKVSDVGGKSAGEVVDILEGPRDDIPTDVVIAIHEASGGDEFLANREEWTVRERAPANALETPFEELTEKELKNVALENVPEERLAYLPNRDTWLWCDDSNIWQENGEQYLREWLNDFLGGSYSIKVRNETADQLKAWVKKDETRFGGGPEGTIAAKNGLVDLEAGELKREIRPEDHVRWTLGTDFDPDAECPKWREFLGEVVEPNAIPQLQEFVGYSAHHWSIPFKKALMLFGPTDAGKSVFSDVVLELFDGDDSPATSNTSIQFIANERWGTATLVNTALNVRNDLDNEQIQNTGVVKEVVAGDSVMAERKMKPVFEFKPTAKHIFAANRAPDRSVDDEAFWNRWLTVIFPESVPRDQQDTELTDTLLDELPGILNWALEGYQRLMDQGRFTDEPYPHQNREKWERYGNSVDQWFDRYTEEDPEAFTPKWSTGDTLGAYECYRAFARSKGLEVMKDGPFTSEMKRRDGVKKKRRKVNSRQVWGYAGFTLTDDAPEPDTNGGDESESDDDGTEGRGLDDFGGSDE